jgi:hypothetical protein
MNLPVAMIMSVSAVTEQFAEVAPDAPALPTAERPPRSRRIRTSVARGLIRAAQVIAPA